MPIDPISSSLGVMQLLGGKGARKKADASLGKADAFNDWLRNLIMGNVKGAQEYAKTGYDKETGIATQRASQVTSDALSKGITSARSQFLTGGGQPGGDTAFNVNAQGMTNRVTDPLREFVAARESGKYSAGLDAIMRAMSGPTNQIAQNYFSSMNAHGAQFNPQSGVQMLAGGIPPGALKKSGPSSMPPGAGKKPY